MQSRQIFSSVLDSVDHYWGGERRSREQKGRGINMGGKESQREQQSRHQSVLFLSASEVGILQVASWLSAKTAVHSTTSEKDVYPVAEDKNVTWPIQMIDDNSRESSGHRRNVVQLSHLPLPSQL